MKTVTLTAMFLTAALAAPVAATHQVLFRGSLDSVEIHEGQFPTQSSPPYSPERLEAPHAVNTPIVKASSSRLIAMAILFAQVLLRSALENFVEDAFTGRQVRHGYRVLANSADLLAG